MPRRVIDGRTYELAQIRAVRWVAVHSRANIGSRRRSLCPRLPRQSDFRAGPAYVQARGQEIEKAVPALPCPAIAALRARGRFEGIHDPHLLLRTKGESCSLCI